MEQTKYKKLKKITLSDVNGFACRSEFNKVVKAFGGKYGFTDSIPWTKEHEEICENHNSWIADLVENGFLENRGKELEFFSSKVYCVRLGSQVYKVYRPSQETISCGFIGINNGTSSSFGWDEGVSREFSSFRSFVRYVKSKDMEIKEFYSLREAMEFYHIDGM